MWILKLLINQLKLILGDKMRVLHLSHIDLDGYGAQYVAKHFFDNISFFNANYGKEVMVRIQEMLKLCKESKEKTLFLITDLNLTLEEAEFLQEQISELKINGYDIILMLLDHHISGAMSAEKFHWYYLDNSRSACKITFDTLNQHYPLLDCNSQNWLNDFSTMVNSVDIWQKEGEFFEFGKVAMGMIANLKDPNRFMFETQNREIKFALLEEIKNFLYLCNAEVEFDNALFGIKKQVFGGNPKTQTMDTILSNYLVALLEKIKEQCSIYYQDKKGFLSYMLGSVSIIGNQFLVQNPDFVFFLDVNTRGNISLRANGEFDVSALASEKFNGGGHKNASGGKIDGFKESFLYEEIKEQIKQILEEV